MQPAPGQNPRRKTRRHGAATAAAIALFHRAVPKNFGVDLEPAPGGAARASIRNWAGAKNLKTFARALLTTRLDRSGARIRTAALGIFVAYAAIGAKLVVLGVSHDPPQTLKGAADEAVSGARPDLLDRNGDILATDVKTMSVFAEPNRIIDKDEAVELITAVLPDVDARELRERLGSKKGFVWIKRQITPKERAEIFHLGLPGVGFLPENKRVYPNGPIGAHVIGFVDKDNVGIAGMEQYLDQQSLTDPHVPGFAVDPESLKPVRLSLDLKVTHALRDELIGGLERFHAKAAAGLVVDVNTGEVLALESLPDFDPNDPGDMKDPMKINRINKGVYE
ncbi:MAG: penicillin-binding protein 2, partial [Roseiarcus sp.]